MAFTINFKNYDGTILQTVEVESGATPEYTGDTPIKGAQYTFTGWNPEIVAATEDADYTATYDLEYVVIDYDQSMGSENRRFVFLVNGSSALTDLPTEAAVGSVAFTADMESFWIKDLDGEWEESTPDAMALASLI
jgi:hypothetical protein